MEGAAASMISGAGDGRTGGDCVAAFFGERRKRTASDERSRRCLQRKIIVSSRTKKIVLDDRDSVRWPPFETDLEWSGVKVFPAAKVPRTCRYYLQERTWRNWRHAKSLKINSLFRYYGGIVPAGKEPIADISKASRLWRPDPPTGRETIATGDTLVCGTRDLGFSRQCGSSSAGRFRAFRKRGCLPRDDAEHGVQRQHRFGKPRL